ncbi:hypothetical protein [Alkalihalobacillus sp. CinArs1]|uniref:hypothetical protein n=1 Tax=Alkalihalobacillus sp. CinArs1 TaxID=2995314 RepID=UPI0022DE554C|nr:hypothetical protein [Alkalihalobacillus sp. CinArs1]
MEKNARGYVQDTCRDLKAAEASLQQALQTVEKEHNKQRIEESLSQLQAVQAYCSETESKLEEH